MTLLDGEAACRHAGAPIGLLREALERHGSVDVRARGGSMAPLIPDGSRCRIVPLRGHPRAGEVIAVARGETLVIHRVIVFKAGGLVTRGDASKQPDPLWSVPEILGRVAEVERPSGRSYGTGSFPWRPLGTLIALFQGLRSRAVKRF